MCLRVRSAILACGRAFALVALGVLVACAALVPTASALELDASRANASLDGSSEAAVEAVTPPGIAALWETAARVEALIEEELSPDVDPTRLFPIDIGDEGAVDVELARLRTLLRAAELDASGAGGRGARARTPRDADARLPVPARWDAQLALDRARLAFYELPVARRTALLEAHTQARIAHQNFETEAERQAREAEAERQRALERVRRAVTEAERLVSEEHARLLAVAAEQKAFERRLAENDAATASNRDDSLKAQRKARDARDSAGKKPAEADEAYDTVRAVLRATRDALDAALDQDPTAGAPVPGAGRLVELNLETDELRNLRAKLDDEAERLRRAARAHQEERLSQLLDETSALNGERLALLPHLSEEKRAAVTGFSAEGTNQAAAELRQLRLVLRYHKHVIAAWAAGHGPPTALADVSPARALFASLEGLVALAAFGWWRRRARATIETMIARVREADRLARATTDSPAIGGLRVLAAVRSPLEWLVLALILARVLPPSLSGLLELQVLVVVLTWTFGGRVVVNAVDALAENVAIHRITKEVAGTPGLRRRSLGLVGRAIVAVGVVLVLCNKLVGRGAIYEWVFTTSWALGLPIGLVLVRWWRDVVFARVERLRKPRTFERWLLRNKKGWASFLAAASGGAYLLATGTYRSLRAWIARFELSRRVMAYLFRRKLDKIGHDGSGTELAPLDPVSFAALGPESGLEAPWIDTPTDDRLSALVERASAGNGGLVALFAERGMGKSRALTFLEERCEGTVRLNVPSARLADLASTMTRTLGGPPRRDVRGALDAANAAGKRVVLLDDAHRLVRPTMGGLSELDALLAAIGTRTEHTLFVLAFDAIPWSFFERAREARPVFDEAIELRRWNEDEIGALLRTRTARAGLEPSFEDLLDPLPTNADDIDRRDALAAREASYHRLVWDHAAGNPGIALDMWRRALGKSPASATFVRVFPSLDLSDLEGLPDTTLFVLRAILQLSPAAPSEIEKATLLRPAQVNDALRYATTRGYVEVAPTGGYRVTWTWFRPIVLFLQRRHLLVSP